MSDASDEDLLTWYVSRFDQDLMSSRDEVRRMVTGLQLDYSMGTGTDVALPNLYDHFKNDFDPRMIAIWLCTAIDLLAQRG